MDGMLEDNYIRQELREFRMKRGRDPDVIITNPQDFINQAYGISVQQSDNIKPGKVVLVEVPRDLFMDYAVSRMKFFIEDYEKQLKVR